MVLHFFTAGTTRRLHVWQLQPRHAAKVKAVNLTDVDGLAGEETLAAHFAERRYAEGIEACVREIGKT